MNIEMIEPDLTGEGLRIAIVQARFNEDICRQLTDACVAELESLGVDERDVLLMTVPGALELPIVLDRLAGTGEFDALIALGCVVRGETYHFEVVSNESSGGITRVALDRKVPIANGVLTVETEAQALDRVQEKGRDCARAAVEMANLCGALDEVDEEEQQ